MAERPGKAALRIDDLHVYYGESHAIQGVSLTLERGVLSVLGRNGMGKTTLCNTIVGLKRARSGSVRVEGREISSLEPHEIHRLGVGYVPQGRRCWPSLTVDEHLRLAAGSRRDAAWTVERIYQTFPRLAERRNNGGSQLSGGEQQMLAIARALLNDPKLLIMDEPTEGLAPMIVAQVERLLVSLAAEDEMAILLIEQNIGVATTVSDRVAIMVNGRINRIIEARALAADRDLQQRLLGVGRHADEESVSQADASQAEQRLAAVYQIERNSSRPRVRRGVDRRLSAGDRVAEPVERLDRFAPRGGRRQKRAGGRSQKSLRNPLCRTDRPNRDRRRHLRHQGQGASLHRRSPESAGRSGAHRRSFDVGKTLERRCAGDAGGEHASSADPSEVMSGDRGKSVTAMAQAFARWVEREPRIGGIISAGGSGGTTLATAGMRALPVGVPKIMISTVAAGDTGKYVGGADIMMLHSVADIQGLNSITEQVLGNGAHALAGMIAQLPTGEALEARRKSARPALGITMFGVTTPCVQAVTRALEADYDCLVFHATGVGGRSMEALGDSRLLAGFLDLTTTEVADMIVGGVFAADQDRLGAPIRTGLPYVGSVGALDMVNFGPRDTIPEKFRNRKFVIHNPNVTLMRTNSRREPRLWRMDRVAPQPDEWTGALPSARGRGFDARRAGQAFS